MTTDDRLDLIIGYLHRAERRQRLHEVAAFLHTLLAIVPMVLFALAAWYAYAHFDEFVAKVVQETTRQAIQSQEGMSEIFKNFFQQ